MQCCDAAVYNFLNSKRLQAFCSVLIKTLAQSLQTSHPYLWAGPADRVQLSVNKLRSWIPENMGEAIAKAQLDDYFLMVVVYLAP